jgi:hypothetical protein
MDTDTNTINTIRAVSFWVNAFVHQDGTVLQEKKRYQIDWYNKVKICGKDVQVIYRYIETRPIGDGRTEVKIYVSRSDKFGEEGRPVSNKVYLWLKIDVPGYVEEEHDLSMMEGMFK